MQCPEKAEHQAEASVDVPYPPLQIVNQFPFVSFLFHQWHMFLHSISHHYIFFTPHAQRERGKVIDRGVHIYIYIYVCSRKKYLNRTLEIDSPSQTLTVGLLVEFID